MAVISPFTRTLQTSLAVAGAQPFPPYMEWGRSTMAFIFGLPADNAPCDLHAGAAPEVAEPPLRSGPVVCYLSCVLWTKR